MVSSRGASLVVALVAFAAARYAAHVTKPNRPMAMEVDGWASKIKIAWPNPITVHDVVTQPSLWKGPIVPTVFHFSYWVWPSSESVLIVNALAFACAAGLLHRVFVLFGHPIAATAALLCWIAMPHYRHLFGHYFSEPLVVLLSAIPFSLLSLRPTWAFRIGLCMGILLLARPPFLLVALAVPVVKWLLSRNTLEWSVRWPAWYSLGFLIAFLPWGIRNVLVVGTFIPFTVEGGQTLFHGSYLGVDEERWQVFHELPEIRPIIDAEPKDPVERMKYLTAIAKQQVLADPLGQVVRCVRKSLRFWVYLDPKSWAVEWKSTTLMVLLLLGAGVAVWRARSPILVWSLTWVLGLWALHTLVFGAMRYNFPVMPLMMFTAASAIWPPKPVSCVGHDFPRDRDDDRPQPLAPPFVQ